MAGMVVSSALVLSRPIMPAAVYALNNKYSWAKQDLSLPGDIRFNNVASSASGSHLIASSFGFAEDHDVGMDPQPFPLYVSTNYGTTWQNVATAADPGIADIWSSVDVTNDGQTMVAVSSSGFDLGIEDGEGNELPGKVILSQDAGSTWTDITPDNDFEGGESQVVISGDGSTIAASDFHNSDKVFITKDGGTNWVTTDYNGEDYSDNVFSLSISDNGNTLLTGTGGSGSEYDKVFISEDGGTNWSGVSPEGANSLIVANTAVSADGSTVAIAGWGGDADEELIDRVFVSNTDGETWTDVTPGGDIANMWGAIDMSDDGKTLAALGIEYRGGEDVSTTMYVSDDSGVTWTQEDPGDSDQAAVFDYISSGIDLNSDGSRAIIAKNSGIYLGQAVSPTVTLTDPNGGKTITLTTPAGTTITCHSAVKEAGLSAKDVAYTYPLGLVDFCFSGAEATNEIRVIFVTDHKLEQVVARKYHTTNGSYSTLTDASITATTYEGKAALQVTYTIEDNGPLDLNPVTGEVSDPVGLAVAELGAPATGIAPANSTNSTNTRLTTLPTGLAVTTSLLMLPIRRAVSSVSRVMSSK